MSTPSHVDRVFIIVKLNEANHEVILGEKDKVHILRICAVRRGIILEKWTDFKVYCEGKFTDLIYRNLNVNRDATFLKQATDYVEGIMKDPFVRYKEKVMTQTDSGPVQQEVDKVRSYTNAEIACNFYVKTNVFHGLTDNQVAEASRPSFVP